MPHMTTYGDQMDRKWTGSGPEVSSNLPSVRPEVDRKCPSVCLSVHPKHFPYLLDEPYARDLQAQGACTLRFFKYRKSVSLMDAGWSLVFWISMIYTKFLNMRSFFVFQFWFLSNSEVLESNLQSILPRPFLYT